MKNIKAINIKSINTILFVFTLILGLCVFILCYSVKYLQYDTSVTDICNARLESLDDKIIVTWTNPKISYKDNIIVNVSSELGNEIFTLDAYENSFVYSNGIHGKLYEFGIRIKYSENDFSKGDKTNGVFLDYDNLPKMPILTIRTKNNELPTSTPIDAPYPFWGASVTNNDYVQAQMSLKYPSGVTFDVDMNFKIRGNTSAYLARKKPYKLKLNQSIDLLNRGNFQYSSKEWTLLSVGTNLNTLLGNYISNYCRNEWQPAIEFVNVIINGDWQGCYLLVESIEKNELKLNVTNYGFIIENDPYWWNDDNLFFRTDYQDLALYYTFKYPSDNLSQDYLDRINGYMNSIEKKLYEYDSNYFESFDVESFASWMLAHDILGTADFAGSNMYLYKNDFSDQSKLKAGPLWDFDSIMTTSDNYASIHKHDAYYYKELFNMNSFNDEYIRQWLAINDSLYNDVTMYINEFLTLYGNELQKSWDLDASRWKKTIPSVDNQVDSIISWFDQRVEWLNENIQQ